MICRKGSGVRLGAQPGTDGSVTVGDVRPRKERVRKPMAQHGIRARHKRKYIATTDSNHDLPVAANLLERNFSPTAPNQVWTSDITYVATAEGWLYLAVIIDLFSR